ncbi:hypothetical protein Egran_01669 [Elaphomyces granulatus]|uniref:Myb-like domain-containing protein n=1 Tax=Elaphomyces granulatus TaxID=519963 RepID=A0A232M2G5_9EURO|nr:hypothetical protein Egran_01669 [Elaphomyces granulatus]
MDSTSVERRPSTDNFAAIRSPQTSKRLKTSVAASAPSRPITQPHPLSAYPATLPLEGLMPTAPPIPPQNPRKRRISPQPGIAVPMPPPPPAPIPTEPQPNTVVSTIAQEPAPKKKGRTNTPWTAEEEQRLKAMRDAGSSWSEIAKTFPTRTEGSVKKHWYKDMHYAEFAEDEVRSSFIILFLFSFLFFFFECDMSQSKMTSQSIALREAIKEYEANKWKVIGQKVGKPAKACEQYAKEHFKNL